MSEIIENIHAYVKEEAKKRKYDWFLKNHVNIVARNAEYLLTQLPDANREVVMLSVWLHDIQRIQRPDMDHKHEETSAQLAMDIMQKHKVNPIIAAAVQKSILSHSAKERIPESLEAKILSTADAMSHFTSDFFLALLVYDRRPEDTPEKFKNWALKKLDKDMNGGKMFFDFAKAKVRPEYERLKDFFSSALPDNLPQKEKVPTR
ncbi:MAG: HD domain-containing protein [Lactobacillales bacterium]|jgi:putative nucleotidyltransferase with HDIG domain|nr:HD domain-containing protein [Lactobacillales bacterium]